VGVRANGRAAGKTSFADLSRSKTMQVCIGPEVLDASRELVLVLDSSSQFSAGLASLGVTAGCQG
jgi:hypothetical protein